MQLCQWWPQARWQAERLARKNKAVGAGCGHSLACHLLRGIYRCRRVGLNHPILLACQGGDECLVRDRKICIGRKGGAQICLLQGDDICVGEICGLQASAIGALHYQLFIAET